MKLMICGTCGHLGNPKTGVRGSLAIEVLLWCFFIVPGLIYSLWRSSSSARYSFCPACKHSGGVMPLDTPRGQQLLVQFGGVTPELGTRLESEAGAEVRKRLVVGSLVGGFGVLLLAAGLWWLGLPLIGWAGYKAWRANQDRIEVIEFCANGPSRSSKAA